MKIITTVDIPPCEKKIDYSSKILTLGSCFADNMGEMMKMYGFDCKVNPFGTLYNVCSVYNSLVRMAAVSGIVRSADNPMFTKADVLLRPDGKFVTWAHHSRCGIKEGEGFTADDFLKKANRELEEASEFLYKADILIITLGTSFVFKLKNTDFVVSNCHKMPAGEFIREFVPAQEQSSLISRIAELFPKKRIILNVSPIRHLADGAHGNKVSKATLLVAIDNAIKNDTTGALEYFPSYEIMMDELRDYRWYAEDMTHPSEQAQKYIFERFTESRISPSCYSKMAEELKRFKALNHQPK